MPIAREAAAVGGADPTAPWSMSWSHTSAGGETTPIIIGFSVQPAATSTAVVKNNMTPTVTIGGVPCMLLSATNSGINDNIGTVYQYIAWDKPGTQTIQVDVSTSGSPTVLHGSSVSYTGVRGVHGMWQRSQSSTSGPSIVCWSATGRMLVSVHTHSGTTFSAFNQTQLYRDTTDSQSYFMGEAAGAASVTFSWTTGSVSSASIVCELVPVEDTTPLVMVRSTSYGGRTEGGTTTSISCSHSHYNDVNKFSSYGVVATTQSIDSSGTNTATVTWGGQAMTEVFFSTYGSGIVRNALGIFILANPPVGNQTISASFAGDARKIVATSVSAVYHHGAAASSFPIIGGTDTEDNTSASQSNTVGYRALVAHVSANTYDVPSHVELQRAVSTAAGAGDACCIQESIGSASAFTFTANSATGGINRTVQFRLMPVVEAVLGARFLAFFN